MWRLCMMASFVLAAHGSVRATEIWKSTFDTDADGVVDIYNDNPAKEMIGAANNGNLEIRVQKSLHGAANVGLSDRAGRPLGVAADGHSELSALYTFMWSHLTTGTAEAWDFAGFSVNTPTNPGTTRGHIGALLRHRKVGDDYLVRVGAQWATTYGQTADTFSADVNLGPDPFSQTYQLAISYLGGTDDIFVLQADLFDNSGTLLGTAAVLTIDGKLPWGSDSAMKTAALNALQLTHLGWGDYWTNVSVADPDTVWQVDSLAFYDTLDGAVNAVVPEPASVMIILSGGLALWRRRAPRGARAAW